MEQNEIGVKVERSFGRTRTGIPVFYVRPAEACENNSRRYLGYAKLNKGIARWYGPEVKYFLVDGHLIGSNNEKNALWEYWKICDKSKIGKKFEVIDYQQVNSKPL